MIHIGIDGNEANVENRVGSNVYAYKLLQQFHKINKDRVTVYLKDEPIKDMPDENKNWKYKVIRPGKLWTQIRLPMELNWGRDKPDVFYTPGHYAPRSAVMPTVMTVLDLAFLHYPQFFLQHKRGVAQLTNWTEYSVEQASHIITISQFSKQDVVDQYEVDEAMVTVAYPGIDTQTLKRRPESEVKALKKRLGLKDRYILYMGTIQPRKNLLRLINAFEQLPPKYKTYQLVIAGQVGWMADEYLAAVERSPKKDMIQQLGFVEEEDKATLLSGAECLCLVGFYEGFGIPPAEALQCGTLAVVSNTSSLPEVVGEAGVMVDPMSVSSISRGIRVAVDMSQEKKKQRLVIAKQHMQQFNWLNSAKIIWEVLHDVAIEG